MIRTEAQQDTALITTPRARASTARTGRLYEGVLRDGNAITWRCGHLHQTRDMTYPARPSAKDCAARELARRTAAGDARAFESRQRGMAALGSSRRVMHDGITWTAEGPRGALWVIIWQPSRGEPNVRAWPASSSGTEARHTGHAADAEAALDEAVRIAALITTAP